VKIVIAGGTGFIGRALSADLLGGGHRVTVLTRDPERIAAGRSDGVQGVQYALWDPMSARVSWIEGADAIINLAGESIGARRWTRAQKARIVGSRVGATRSLVAACRSAGTPPSVFVSASGVGYYGNVDEGEVTEDHPPGDDFLATTCRQWEAEAMKAEALGIRTVCVRSGVVLGDRGGALDRMKVPFRLFVGGTIGSGRQWFPWIHRRDLVAALRFAIEQDTIAGPVNATSPGAVRMKEFCRTLGSVLRRPCWFPVPAPLLRIVLGEFSETVLTGQKAVPMRLLTSGFPFSFPTLEPALSDILRVS
jgi:uncharacterized protein (TIGR01777 family)